MLLQHGQYSITLPRGIAHQYHDLLGLSKRDVGFIIFFGALQTVSKIAQII
jgi:hypothetical protein